MGERQDEFDLDLGDPADSSGEVGPGKAAGSNRTGLLGGSRGPVPWLALGATLVLAGVVAAPDPPREQIGIIDHVDEPEQQWTVEIGEDHYFSTDASPVMSPPALLLAEDAIIYVEPEHIQAHSLEDGAVLWTADGTDLYCHLNDPQLLCSSGQQTDAELLRLDTTEGVLDRTDRPGLLAALPVADDLITVEADASGIVAARERPGGEQVWSYPVDSIDPWAGGPDPQTMLDQLGDQVLITVHSDSHSSSAVLEASSGRAHGVQDLALFPHPWSVTGDWLAMRPDGALHFVGAGGDLGVPWLPGERPPQVDDDVAADLRLVLSPEGLAAVSRETGHEVWGPAGTETGSSAGAGPIPVARLDDVVIAHAGQFLIAIDLPTGEELWSRTAPVPQVAFSDGEILVHAGAAPDQTLQLIGFEPDTGDTLFELSSPGAALRQGAVVDGRLVLLSDLHLSLWTW